MTRSEFEKMASELRKEMLTIGMAFFGNREDAEDVAQEGLVKLWSYCEHIDTRRNVKALAVRVAKTAVSASTGNDNWR